MSKGLYIYEGHLGSLYTSDRCLNYDELYCEQCGDSDWYIGYAETKEEAWELLKDDTNTFDESLCENCPHADDYDYCEDECDNYAHSGGWNYEYVQNLINENFND